MSSVALLTPKWPHNSNDGNRGSAVGIKPGVEGDKRAFGAATERGATLPYFFWVKFMCHATARNKLVGASGVEDRGDDRVG